MQSLSYITHIIDNNDLSKSLICLSTYSHLDWAIKIHVWAIGIHCFEVVAKYYQQWQSHCFKQLQTGWPHMWSNCLCILKLNSPYFKQMQTVSPHTQSNCLCILNLNSHCFNQTNTINLTLYVVTSPLSLSRDSFITLDLNDFFSSTNTELAFLPWKLIASHSQGFRVLTYL